VGTCGFPVSRALIFSTLDAVELQETFYSMPDPNKMKRLRNNSPEGFEFTVKVFQGITHGQESPTMRRARNFKPQNDLGKLKPSKANIELWESFYAAVEPLRPSFFVFQTPPSFGTDVDMKNALEFFKITGNKRIGWEPRGISFKNTEVLKKIFEETGIVHVYDPLRRNPLANSEILYIRLHGIGNKDTNYSYRYTEGDLKELNKKILGKSQVYVMFNNIYMFENAKEFKEIYNN
jgi:uncharacterized protein YecE (DUF72 family)